MLKLVRQWLEAGVMDRRTVSPTVAGTPQGGVIILQRLGLELHPDKKRRVERYDGKQGFDFLGCHLHKRLSGKLLEEKGQRLYFPQRWPSQRAMQRIGSV